MSRKERRRGRNKESVVRNRKGWKGKKDEEIHGRVLTTCIKIKIEVEQKVRRLDGRKTEGNLSLSL